MPQQIGLPMDIQLPPTTCTICGRALTDSTSIARGIGPICAAHNAGEFVAKEDEQQLIDEDLFTVGAVIRPNGTNVPRLISRHSPTGFAWGYGGSGPADLALNICEAFARHMGETPGEEEGTTELAEAAYQPFKWAWIATLPQEGGHIPAHVIVEFLEKYQHSWKAWNRSEA